MNFICGYFAWDSLILYTPPPKDLYVPYISALFRLEAILNLLCTLLPHNRVLLKMVGTCKPAWRETSDVGGYLPCPTVLRATSNCYRHSSETY